MTILTHYEMLPFSSALPEASAVTEPLTLTVTCSPKHGPDRTVEMAVQLAGLGHAVIPHIAARMVKGPEHLDHILETFAGAGVEDVFVVGGDLAEPLGPYSSGFELLTALRAHRLCPPRLGAPAYPEGHPLIDDAVLREDLAQKATVADYLVTQMCFDPDALARWIHATRAAQIDTPIFLGLAGAVDRTRLLEISMRVGVGASISYLRKSKGVTRLLRRGGTGPAQEMLDQVASLIGGPLGVVGIHLFTFNRLVLSVELMNRQDAAMSGAAERPGRPAAQVVPRS